MNHLVKAELHPLKYISFYIVILVQIYFQQHLNKITNSFTCLVKHTSTNKTADQI